MKIRNITSIVIFLLKSIVLIGQTSDSEIKPSGNPLEINDTKFSTIRLLKGKHTLIINTDFVRISSQERPGSPVDLRFLPRSGHEASQARDSAFISLNESFNLVNNMLIETNKHLSQSNNNYNMLLKHNEDLRNGIIKMQKESIDFKKELKQERSISFWAGTGVGFGIAALFIGILVI